LEEGPQDVVPIHEEEAWPEVDVLSQPPGIAETVASPAAEPTDGSSSGQETPWREWQDRFDTGEIVELEVVGCNRGGVLVDCGPLQGFVPASQLMAFRHGPEENRGDQLQEMVGRKLQLKIIELDEGWNRLILSERAAESGPGSPKEILEQLKPGQVCEGWITNLCPFGAFVDLGGIEGLIHISELSWGRVDSPQEVLSADSKVEVYVLNVDRDRRRVGLSLKRLRPNPWSSVEENYQVGQLVGGKVTNVVDFGAFVRLEEGLEGLVHVSELADGSFLHPRNVVREGEEVTVRVIRIDSQNHRLGLSIRQV
jgi:small subunit ribosomal protein S1